MKRALTLLLALMLVIALFAGCGGNKPTPTNTPAANTPATNTPAANTPAAGTTPTPPPATPAPEMVENGKEAVYPGLQYNEYGVPEELFSYEDAKALPLTKTPNKPFTWFMSMTESTMQLYSFDSVNELDAHKELYERTGVVIEYVVVGSTALSTSYATMFAGDDLTDLMSQASQYYPRSMISGVDDEYFVNIYDYLEYMPCYHYSINMFDDDEVWDYCYGYDKMMPLFISPSIVLYNTQGLVIRGDYLEQLNMKAEDVRTVDEMHNLLKRLKTEVTECSWPVLFGAVGDFMYGGVSNAWNTYGAWNIMTGGAVNVYVVDGEVRFPYCTNEIREYLGVISAWYSEGLIDPDMPSYQRLSGILTPMTNGIGVGNGSISFIKQWISNNANKNAYYVAIPNLVQKRGDEHHLKSSTASHLTTVTFSVSADCKDIPLLLSWCDYWYSDKGFYLTQYGLENKSYTLDENGQVWWTELIYNNPHGLTIAGCWEIYATNSMGNRVVSKGNFYPEGIKNIEYTTIWESVPNDMSYKYPSAIQLTEEKKNEFATKFADVSTFITENYAKFINGSKPLSEWDAYVAECKKLKLDECIQIYQDAYDEWISNKPIRYGKEK